MTERNIGNNLKEPERGYVLVTVAALLVMLLGFTALAVDIGIMFSARTQLQEAADAAAIAGAFTFINNPSASQPSTAILTAQKAALANKMLGTAIAAGDVTVSVPWPPTVTGVNRVIVSITKSQSSFFAKAISTNSMTIGVRAVAEANDDPQCDRCARPFFIPNNILSPNGVAACTACANNQVLIGSDGTFTSFGQSFIGSQFTIKPQDPSGNIAPGVSYLVAIGGNGGNDVRNNIALCANIEIVCQNSYSVKTGVTKGPVKQGVDDLIGDPPTDTFVSPGHYRNRYDNIVRSSSRALVTAPVWDSCASDFCPGGVFPNGSGTVLKVIGFALVFIEGATTSGGPDANITARLVDVAPCGPSVPNGCVSGAGAFAHPIRLVRTE